MIAYKYLSSQMIRWIFFISYSLIGKLKKIVKLICLKILTNVSCKNKLLEMIERYRYLA